MIREFVQVDKHGPKFSDSPVIQLIYFSFFPCRGMVETR